MKKGLSWFLVPAVLGIAGYFALFGGDYSVFDVRRARAELSDRSGELSELAAETDSLDARAQALENDPLALEDIARGKYGMLAKDELLYAITEPDSAAVDSLEAADPNPRDESTPDL